MLIGKASVLLNFLQNYSKIRHEKDPSILFNRYQKTESKDSTTLTPPPPSPELSIFFSPEPSLWIPLSRGTVYFGRRGEGERGKGCSAGRVQSPHFCNLGRQGSYGWEEVSMKLGPAGPRLVCPVLGPSGEWVRLGSA